MTGSSKWFSPQFSVAVFLLSTTKGWFSCYGISSNTLSHSLPTSFCLLRDSFISLHCRYLHQCNLCSSNVTYIHIIFCKNKFCIIENITRLEFSSVLCLLTNNILRKVSRAMAWESTVYYYIIFKKLCINE